MAGEDTIEVDGRVIELMPNPAVCRVELPNGHVILAHRSRGLRSSGVEIAPGMQVRVHLSPFDMSQGKIIGKKD